MRSTSGRIQVGVASLVVLALGLAGCHYPGGGQSGPPPDSRPGRVHVVAPADHSQAAANGDVPVDVRLDERIDARTFRVWLVSGSWEHRQKREITDQLVRDETGATGTLHAADLQPGVTKLEAIAAPRRHWSHGRDDDHERESDHRGDHDSHDLERGSSTFSWEPAVDLATADRCDILAAREVPHAVPERLLHRARPTRRPPVGACTSDPTSMPTNSSGVPIDPDRVEPQRRLQPRAR